MTAMTTLTTFEAPRLADLYILTDRNQEEILAAQSPELSARHINHYLSNPGFRETGYNTTTYGHIGFTHVEPVQVTEDNLLQARLDILCDKLRAKY
jgi:hypothetical protein